MKNKSAFTLVELITVIAIMGILSAMAIPAFQKVRDSSRRKAGMGQYSPNQSESTPKISHVVIDGRRYRLIEE